MPPLCVACTPSLRVLLRGYPLPTVELMPQGAGQGPRYGDRGRRMGGGQQGPKALGKAPKAASGGEPSTGDLNELTAMMGGNQKDFDTL